MCGRILIRDPVRLLRPFRVQELRQTPRDLVPRFNLAPTQQVPIIRRLIVRKGEDGGRELAMVRWGLIPGWARDLAVGSRMINARAEGVADKTLFRDAFRRRRCIIPADGFYEWRRSGKTKQPYVIRRKDGEPLGFAGLWESWTDPAIGEVVETCTIITCAPNALMAELHDRMPVILDPADYDRWLDPRVAGGEEMLRPCPAEWLEAYPVSSRVNSPANDDEDLLSRIESPAAGELGQEPHKPAHDSLSRPTR